MESKRGERERTLTAVAHRQPDRVPVDFGSTFVTGIHVTCVAALREHYGLDRRPVKVIDPGQFLGEIEDDLKPLLGIDTEGVFRRTTRFGFPLEGWKPWRTNAGLEVLVPAGFNVTIDENGDALMHPGGDTSLPPSARMPNGGHYFDAIIRQPPIDESRLDPADNLEEFTRISESELDHLEREARRARATGRAVVASFGGTAFGDVGHIPGMALRHPRGIRDIAEWYISTKIRRGYVRQVFEGQCKIALENLERIAARVRDFVDVVMICGTDFGTQNSTFCSEETFEELWMPVYREVNGWIHRHTPWRTLKHSCGAVKRFIPQFIEAGFDILNPVQCSAAGMDAESLKEEYGTGIVYWGGGVDTQAVLPFGTPAEVRDLVLRRCEVFGKGGGFVFSSIHNIQPQTPVANIVAMVEALAEFSGD